MSRLQDIAGFLALPVVATIVGGIIATIRPPGPRLQSYIQHITAGIVFAAVAGELIPEIKEERAPLPVILGFGIGVAVMLGMRWLTAHLSNGRTQEGKAEGEAEDVVVPASLLATVAIDLWIDGLLVGVGFAAGAQQGMLLAIALTLEVLFLGLATAAALIRGGASRGWVVAMIMGLSFLVAAGAMVGVILLNGLTGAALEIALSFGAAALLYLVTEELLVEAHEVPETPLSTALFFAGFLALFTIEMLIGAAA